MTEARYRNRCVALILNFRFTRTEEVRSQKLPPTALSTSLPPAIPHRRIDLIFAVKSETGGVVPSMSYVQLKESARRTLWLTLLFDVIFAVTPRVQAEHCHILCV